MSFTLTGDINQYIERLRGNEDFARLIEALADQVQVSMDRAIDAVTPQAREEMMIYTRGLRDFYRTVYAIYYKGPVQMAPRGKMVRSEKTRSPYVEGVV